jgi:DNA-binding MarR family transcriptional regulator
MKQPGTLRRKAGKGLANRGNLHGTIGSQFKSPFSLAMTAHLNETLPFLINRVAALASDEVNRQFQSFGLNIYAARVLIVLYLDDAHAVGELAEKCALDQSTLSHILRRLVKQDLLVKERQEHDNRSVLVSLTKQGAATAAKCWKAVQVHDALLRRDMDAATVAQLKKLLNQLYVNVPAFRTEGRARVSEVAAPRKRKTPSAA